MSDARGEMAGLRGEWRSELHHGLRIQFYWTASLFTVLLAAFIAAIKLV